MNGGVSVDGGQLVQIDDVEGLDGKSARVSLTVMPLMGIAKDHAGNWAGPNLELFNRTAALTTPQRVSMRREVAQEWGALFAPGALVMAPMRTRKPTSFTFENPTAVARASKLEAEVEAAFSSQIDDAPTFAPTEHQSASASACDPFETGLPWLNRSQYPLWVYSMHVGHGEANVVLLPPTDLARSQIWLIDGYGEKGMNPVRKLEQRDWIADVFLVTHSHSDHLAKGAELVLSGRVRELVVHGRTRRIGTTWLVWNSAAAIARSVLRPNARGHALDTVLNGVDIRLMASPAPLPQHPNSESVVASFRLGRSSALLLADLPPRGLHRAIGDAIATTAAGTLSTYTKVGHHGSTNAYDPTPILGVRTGLQRMHANGRLRVKLPESETVRRAGLTGSLSRSDVCGDLDYFGFAHGGSMFAAHHCGQCPSARRLWCDAARAPTPRSCSKRSCDSGCWDKKCI